MKRNDLREGRSAAGLSTCRLSAPLLASKIQKGRRFIDYFSNQVRNSIMTEK